MTEPQLVDPARILAQARANIAASGLADAIQRQVSPPGTPPAKMRLGYVQSFDPTTWTCTAFIGDLLTPIPNIPVLGNVLPASESSAIFLQTGGESTTQYVLVGTMSKDAGTPTYGQTWRIRKTADQIVTNSSTAVPDTALAFTGQAGRVYIYDALLIVTQNGTTNAADLKAGWSLPAGATWSGGAIGPISSLAGSGLAGESTGAGANWRAYSGATGTLPYGTDPFLSGSHPEDNYAIHVRLEGTIEMGSTSGLCSVAWAQQTAQASINTTVKKGSFLKVDMTSEYTL